MDTVTEALHLTARVVRSRAKRLWTDYDREADLLYISFEQPQDADQSEMAEDDVLVHYRSGNVVGVTIMNASTRRHG